MFYSNISRCLALLIPVTVWAITVAAADDAPQERFVNMMQSRYHYPAAKTRHWLAMTHIDNHILNQMHHPYEKQHWNKYRRHFLSTARITGGVNYWRAHHQTLQRVEKRYAVPASLVVAIIGVESRYGRYQAPHSALNTLSTLAFYGPNRRQDYFSRELAALLLLSEEQHIAPNSIGGSYAGALGIPQFMPSTYRYFAVSADKKRPADLLHNNDDAILSIANYIHQAHWRPHQPIASLEAQPSKSSQQITLNGKQLEYWHIHHNFHAIMAYNHSHLYAMAVAQLAQRIEKQYYGRQYSNHHWLPQTQHAAASEISLSCTACQTT